MSKLYEFHVKARLRGQSHPAVCPVIATTTNEAKNKVKAQFDVVEIISCVRGCEKQPAIKRSDAGEFFNSLSHTLFGALIVGGLALYAKLKSNDK